MNISKNFGFKIPKNIHDECDGKGIADQINIINMAIFEDVKIDHLTRLERQYDLLAYSDNQKTDLPSAYILNLVQNVTRNEYSKHVSKGHLRLNFNIHTFLFYKMIHR